ncbi:MAG: MFS transporter, partial [Thiotrichaceae bacterium]
MNKLEQRTAITLAAVYSVRMLGLFMILPILPLYSQSLSNITPFLIGIAIGIYGLTQATFQIPLGLLSDKIGRKPVIVGGLLVFAFGSVVAALADDNFYQIIVGRALQGMGAIAAATMALAADLTREEHRAKIMAAIGMTIGVAFAIAMVAGPVLYQQFGISGIFWITAGLAIAGIFLIVFAVPTPVKTIAHRDAGIIGGYLKPALKNASLVRINISVFLLHLIMTANFTVIPLVLKDELGFADMDHWKVYLPIFVISFLLSVPQIIIAEKYRKIKPLFLFSIVTLGIAQFILGSSHASFYPMLLAFLLFFIGFNFMEAVLPSLVAKYSNVNTKGTAMGVFSTAQFSGIFVGGVVGGYIATQWGRSEVLYMGAAIAVIWFLIAMTLPTPVFYKARTVHLRDEHLKNPSQTASTLMQ